MSSSFSLCELLPTIKEVIESGKEVSFTPNGISMRPMLYGGRDEIVLIKPNFPLKKYDLPLYVRKNGDIILHRVIKVERVKEKNFYTMRGDNTYVNEPGITDEQIVGVVTQFRRKNKWYKVTDKRYSAYEKIWCFIYPLRKPLRAIIRLPFRALRKVKSFIIKP